LTAEKGGTFYSVALWLAPALTQRGPVGKIGIDKKEKLLYNTISTCYKMEIRRIKNECSAGTSKVKRGIGSRN
jgi:hypothetical protein